MGIVSILRYRSCNIASHFFCEPYRCRHGTHTLATSFEMEHALDSFCGRLSA
jgi:hypothetical protein